MFRRLLWRPETAFFLLCFALVSARFRDRAFNDPGALWHVKVGERILSDGFMHTDPFTFTFADRTWIPQQWGGEVAMAVAHTIGGFDTLLLGFSVLVAGLYTWLFARAVRDGMHPLLAGVVIGGAAVVAAFHFYARPHMATLVGMAVTMGAIVDYERGRATAWRLFALIPTFAVWTNIHGGVLGGTLTLWLAVAGWGAVFLLKPGEERFRDWFHTPVGDWRTVWLLAAIVAACALTPFVNPFGMEMIRTWRKIVGSPAVAELVSEHQPLSLEHTAGQVVVGLALFYAFMLLGVNPRQWRVSWLLPAVWFLLTLKGIRQGPLFAVCAAVVIADVWPHTRWYALVKRHGDTLATEPEAEPRGWGWLLVPVVLVTVALGLQTNGANAPFVGRGWATLDKRAWPVELTDTMREYAESVPDGTPIFNDANLGGYVLYHAPSLKIFMDDRFELYGDQWLTEYVDALDKHPERFDDWAKKYGFEVALIGIEGDPSPLEKHLNASKKTWVEVRRCDRAVMYRKAKQ